MARYLTEEELFNCPKCEAQATRREFYDGCHALKCPSCHHNAFERQTGCEIHDRVPETTPMTGIFSVRYMGFGHVDLPEISVQEDRWEPGYCFDCHVHEMVRALKVFDAAEAVGIKRPYQMPGIDVIANGGQLVLPFMSSNRIWIGGKEVAHMEYYDKSSNNWDYYL